jgi:pyridoxine/pyridoxamine 5'-phosphate oxidase
MLEKVVKKRGVRESASTQEDLAYWLSRPPEERVAAVDYLRRQYYGNAARLQRVARVIRRPPR